MHFICILICCWCQEPCSQNWKSVKNANCMMISITLPNQVSSHKNVNWVKSLNSETSNFFGCNRAWPNRKQNDPLPPPWPHFLGTISEHWAQKHCFHLEQLPLPLNQILIFICVRTKASNEMQDGNKSEVIKKKGKCMQMSHNVQ